MFLLFRIFTERRKSTFHDMNLPEAPALPSLNLDNLKLIELVGRGRCGAVWRGSLDERPVAVKVLPAAYHQNYLTEKELYRLPHMAHDNIVHFIAAEERMGPESMPEYLIFMEYYTMGSLADFLTRQTSDWLTLCKLSHGLTRGLAYLHAEIVKNGEAKPAIAHRDLNSQNILVRSDGSCVLGDLGFSMRLSRRGSSSGDDDAPAISEVGTIRYMAPEVLEGAVNLCDCESALKQVDVYALGLVYWEIFSRCSDLFAAEGVPTFQLAYQAETGSHPSIEDMQVVVVREKCRPQFPKAWKENSLLVRCLKETMEDCWDQDPDARLTSLCAEERMAELMAIWERSSGVGLLGDPSNMCTTVHNERNIIPNWRFAVRDAGSGSGKAEPGTGINGNRQHCFAAHGSSRNTDTQSVPEKNLHYLHSRHNDIPSSVQCVTENKGNSGTSELESNPSPNSLQLVADDIQAMKLDPLEVGKNLKESSDESLTKTASSKQFAAVSDACHTDEPMVPSRMQQPVSSAALATSIVQSSLQQGLLHKQLNLPLTHSREKSSSSLIDKKSNLMPKEKSIDRIPISAPSTVVEMNGTIYGKSKRSQEDPPTQKGVLERGDHQGSTSSPDGVLGNSPDENAPLINSEMPKISSTPLINNRPLSKASIAKLVWNVNNCNNNHEEQENSDGVWDKNHNNAVGTNFRHDNGCRGRERRPRRPISLDLTKALSTDKSRDCANTSMETPETECPSGERIRKRVKTPYALTSAHPSVWVRLPEKTNRMDNRSRSRADSFPTGHIFYTMGLTEDTV
uniref:bone morphogenetic protein receptor type-2-like n=1 Tax=Myxine glutinosa TaxID=7769 RepID=UPI00358EEFA0